MDEVEDDVTTEEQDPDDRGETQVSLLKTLTSDIDMGTVGTNGSVAACKASTMCSTSHEFLARQSKALLPHSLRTRFVRYVIPYVTKP